MILQVITNTDRRGAQVFATDLARSLRALGRPTEIVALERGADADGLAVRALGDRGAGLSLGTLRRLRAETRHAKVVVAHGSSTLPACVLATVGQGRCVVYRNIGHPSYWANTWRRRMQTRLLYARVLAVVALWPKAEDELATLFRVPRRRMFRIPTGVPAERIPPATAAARNAARAGFGLAAERKVLAYIGSLSEEKDVGVAIDAVASLPDVALLAAGAGPLRDALSSQADAAGADVRFLGATDPRPVLAAADALVLTSRSEGIPAVLIEAGFAGLPVVSTDVGGVREVVRPGVTGELVTPGDPTALAEVLRDLLAQPTRRAAYGAAARAHCLARFEIGVVAAAWDDVLAALGAWERRTVATEEEETS